MRDGKMKEIELDPSKEIIIDLAIELPFWIPIKSGEYSLKGDRSARIRNDLWLVSITNIVDGPVDQPFDHIVNEGQVTDKKFLQNLIRGHARYYHKRKMKTTFTRSLSIIPMKGAISAQPPSEVWQQQMSQLVFGLLQQQSRLEGFLDDINLFIDVYSTLINPQNPTREVRRVNFFETMVNVRMICKTEKYLGVIITKVTPDLKMAGLPFPAFRVKGNEKLSEFREIMRNLDGPAFHQLQWVKSLNYKREKRYQEGLIHTAITLESVVHLYLSAQGLSKKERKKVLKKAEGISGWLRELKPKGLVEDCENVAELWKLRNKVVHEQKILLGNDIEQIQKGIQSFALVRTYLLHTGKSDVVELESKFSSFFEQVELGQAKGAKIGQMVQMKFGWRREKDCYQTLIDSAAAQ
jgi:hypothetical protein